MARTTGAATDLITFSRASSGTALTKVAYGPELLTNGDFSAGTTNWNASSAGSVFYIENGVAVVEALPSDWSRLSVVTNINMELNEVYALTFTNEGVGNVSIQNWIPGAGNYYIYSPGTHTIYAVCDDTADTFQFITATQNAELRISNVSVRKVLTNDPTGTLKLVPHGINKPRVEYDANGVAKGLLIEEQRTNLVTYSEDFSSWGLLQVSLQSGLVSPDGSSLATKIVPDTSLNAHYITKANLFASGQTYSLFVKAAGYNYVSIGDGSNTFGAKFDLINKTATVTHGSVTAEIEEHANGWFRIYGTTSSNVQNQFRIWPLDISTRLAYQSYEGDGTSGIYIWGAQLEAGSFPTSYIPTSGAAATRSADIASVSVSEFGYNQAQGSVVVEYAPIYPYNAPNILQVDNNTTGNRIYWQMTGANPSDLTIGSAGASTTLLITHADVFDDSDNVKIATGWALNDVASSVGGSAVLTDNTFSGLSADVTRITIGHLPPAGIAQCNGHIKSLNYYPLRLSDAKLQSLTS